MYIFLAKVLDFEFKFISSYMTVGTRFCNIIMMHCFLQKNSVCILTVIVTHNDNIIFVNFITLQSVFTSPHHEILVPRDVIRLWPSSTVPWKGKPWSTVSCVSTTDHTPTVIALMAMALPATYVSWQHTWLNNSNSVPHITHFFLTKITLLTEIQSMLLGL